MQNHFTHYKNKYNFHCNEYENYEEPYQYCSVKWKRIENPDYMPLPPGNSGIIACEGDLQSCLTQHVPKINRYINVPDGETCHSGTHSRQRCLAGQWEHREIPQYDRNNYTQYHVYRFEGDQFIKLDNQLAAVDDNNIVITEDAFRLPGHIQSHDHMNFENNHFYTITSGINDNQHRLHTLALSGNSAVKAHETELNSDSYYSRVKAKFTQDRIYISETGSSYYHRFTDMQTLSLADPLAPIMETTIELPTSIEQLLFTGNSLLGLGNTSISGRGKKLGSITSFNTSGEEEFNLLLGADYSHYNSNYSYDDQVLALDTELNRLLVPYSVYDPIADFSAPPSDNRLSLIRLQQSTLEEEHTFSLPRLPERSMSLTEPFALTFSDEFIHSLSQTDRDSDWQQQAIFDGEIPASIYYTRTFPAQVQKYQHPDKFIFKLINAADGANGNTLATLELPRASTDFCFRERVYFDQDRILIVSEHQGSYFSYYDCPDYRSENPPKIEMTYTGYRIGEQDFTVINDQQELQDLYQQIQWDVHCILDIDNLEGVEIDSEEIDLQSEEYKDLACFTAEQYYELAQEARQAAWENQELGNL